MASYQERIEEIMDKEFCQTATRRAVTDQSIPACEYGSINLDFRNDARSETDYLIEFGDDEAIEVKFNTRGSNKSFYFLEAVSQGFNAGSAATGVYKERGDLPISIRGALNDNGMLEPEYTEPLAELLNEEIWR